MTDFDRRRSDIKTLEHAVMGYQAREVGFFSILQLPFHRVSSYRATSTRPFDALHPSSRLGFLLLSAPPRYGTASTTRTYFLSPLGARHSAASSSVPRGPAFVSSKPGPPIRPFAASHSSPPLPTFSPPRWSALRRGFGRPRRRTLFPFRLLLRQLYRTE